MPVLPRLRRCRPGSRRRTHFTSGTSKLRYPRRGPAPHRPRPAPAGGRPRPRWSCAEASLSLAAFSAPSLSLKAPASSRLVRAIFALLVARTTTAATSPSVARALAAASAGFRRHHRQACSAGLDAPGQDRLVGQEPPQVLGHLLGRGVPLGRLLGDRLQDDRLQVARDASGRACAARSGRRAAPGRSAWPGSPPGRGLQRQQLVEGRPPGRRRRSAGRTSRRTAPAPCSAGCRRCRRSASGRRSPRPWPGRSRSPRPSPWRPGAGSTA